VDRLGKVLAGIALALDQRVVASRAATFRTATLTAKRLPFGAEARRFQDVVNGDLDPHPKRRNLRVSGGTSDLLRGGFFRGSLPHGQNHHELGSLANLAVHLDPA
jgi:hypothetical protein